MNKQRIEYRRKNKIKIYKTSKLYKLNHPWLNTLSNIQQRCNNPKFPKFRYYGAKGIKCLLTSEELKELWYRDKAWLLKKPSIDRKDSKKDYEFDNCQFIEMNINRIKDCIKSISQYDLNGNFIKEWDNTTVASNFIKIHKSGISACARGKQNTAGGFVWKYKNR